MEIPHSNLYKTIERKTSIDFLNEGLKVTFSFDEEATDNLPRVSDDDLITGNEKYRILLGDIDQQGDSWVNIKIRGVLEADASEKSLFYKEGKEEVNPNLGNIKQWVKSIQNSIPEFSNFHFIGDIHTHPIIPGNNLEKNIHPCNLSNGDIADIIQQYESGNLSFGEPFIFGIAGRRDVQENTTYAFYRLVKKDGGYIIDQIEKK